MACSFTLNGLANQCDTSVGGIKNIWIANYTEGAFSGNTANTLDFSTDFKDSASTEFKKYYVRKNTTSFTSTLNADVANGVSYVSTELALVFTKMETVKRIEIAALTLADTMIIIQDCNNKFWVMGEESPVYATAGTAETGTAATDGSKYSITLTDENSSFLKELSSDAVAVIKAIV